MLNYLKDRIALIILLIAGDSISLITFIKAAEIKADCRNLAASISLLLSLVISLTLAYFLKPASNKWHKWIVAAVCLLCWLGYLWSYDRFSTINSTYGKIPYPSNQTLVNPIDSFIVGGCAYAPPAKAEVDSMRSQGKMLNYSLLFADFNYDVNMVWTEESRDCARDKILWAFSIMIGLLVAGITITIELLIKKNKAAPNGDKQK